MENTHDVVSERISQLIAYGQRIYDADGNKVGTVALYDTRTGWLTVQRGTFVRHELYVPFRAIATIDRREITLTLSRDDLLASYTNPPARITLAATTESPGSGATEQVTMTTVPSGFTGAPVQVDHTNLDEIKRQIAIGMRVFDVYGDKVGTIKSYNVARDYLMVTGGILPHVQYVPLAIVDGVDLSANDVHLAVTKDHLRRVYVLQPEDGMGSSMFLAPDN